MGQAMHDMRSTLDVVKRPFQGMPLLDESYPGCGVVGLATLLRHMLVDPWLRYDETLPSASNRSCLGCGDAGDLRRVPCR